METRVSCLATFAVCTVTTPLLAALYTVDHDSADGHHHRSADKYLCNVFMLNLPRLLTNNGRFAQPFRALCGRTLC